MSEGNGQADVKEVTRHARGWSDSVLLCRTYGHQWTPGYARYNGRYKYWAVMEKCGRCDAERHRELDQRGKRTSSYIRYPEGYLLEGMGRIVGEARDMLLLTTITRTFDVEKVNGKRADADLPHSRATRRELGIELESA